MKKKYIVIILAALLLAATAFGIYRLATYESANHAHRLSKATVENYNLTVSTKASSAGQIRSREVVLVDTVTRTRGQDAVVVFRIYQMPDGTTAKNFAHLRADQVPADSGLTERGTLTCRMVENDPSTVYSLQSSYTR